MKNEKDSSIQTGPGRRKDADSTIISMARKGAFERIGEAAIAATHKLGKSATVLLDGAIYELHPDGSRTLLKTL